jgi:hypothetical protein
MKTKDTNNMTPEQLMKRVQELEKQLGITHKTDGRKNRGKCTLEQLEARRKRKTERDERWRLHREGLEAKRIYKDFLALPWWMSEINDRERKLIVDYLKDMVLMESRHSAAITGERPIDIMNRGDHKSEKYKDLFDARFAVAHLIQLLSRCQSNAIGDFSLISREN